MKELWVNVYRMPDSSVWAGVSYSTRTAARAASATAVLEGWKPLYRIHIRPKP